jgi:predicted phosphoribosyltransferase
MPVPFRDRTDAGRQLASCLSYYVNRPDVVVLALPRGGVPVGLEVAENLNVVMDVFLVRKLGVPGHEELAMGAIASGGIRVVNESLVRELGLSPHLIDRVARTEERELARREQLYRDARPQPEFRGRTVILVDDGLATGSTMRAAIAAVRARKPARIVVAVPVAAPAACAELQDEVDEIICAEATDPFIAVGYWYDDFSPITDEKVRDLLARVQETALGQRGPVR